METKKNLKEHDLILTIFFAGVLSSVFYMLNQKIVPDSVQLLERGYLFLEGQLLPFGPRSTNTNFVYGPLISIFVGFSLRIYQHPLAPLTAILFFHIVGFFAILKTKFLHGVPGFTPIFMLLYWLSPWRSSEVFLWNPSLLFPLMALYLYGIDLMLRNQRFWGTFLMTLIVALTFQVHNSFLFLIFLGLWLIFKYKMIPHWGALLLASLIGGIMLIPSLKVILSHPEVLELNRHSAPLFKNFFHGGEAIKGLTYWLRYPSLYFGATTFQLPKVDWHSSGYLEQIWWGIKWVLAFASLVFALKANISFFKNTKGQFIRELSVGAIVSLAIVSALSPVSFNFWHLYLIYPIALIPVAWYIALKIKDVKITVATLGMYFIVYALVSSHSSFKHSFATEQAKSYQNIVLKNGDRIKEKYLNFSLSMN